MTVAELVRLAKKFGPATLLLATLAALVAGLFSRSLQPSFEASASVFVGRESQAPSSGFYSFDGYYSQQAAERFTDTAMGVMRNKEIVKLAARESGFSDSAAGSRDFSRRLKVKRAGPQLIALSFADRQKEKAVLFIQNLAKITAQKIDELNKKGDRLLTLSVLEPVPFVEERVISPWLVSVSFFGGTVIFSAVVLILLDSFGRERLGRR